MAFQSGSFQSDAFQIDAGAVTLAPQLLVNSNSFFSATVTTGAVDVAPNRYENSQAFYAATVTRGAVTLTPSRYDNAQAFYTPVVTQSGGTQYVVPDLYSNTQAFYAFKNTLYITFPDWVETGWVEPGWTAWPNFNTNQFFTPEVTLGPEPPVILDRGDGVDPRKRKPREFNKEEANALREMITKIIDPVKEEAPAQAKIVKTEKAVAVVTPTRTLTIPTPPSFDAAAVAAEVGKILERAGIQAKAARDAESRRIAEAAFAEAQENMRLRMKRRREEELLLLL